MDNDTAAKRHLTVVRAPDIYDDSHAPTGWRERDDGSWEEYLVAGPSPTITPEAPANERWLACDRPDERLRYGAYLCACATCLASLRRQVVEFHRPGMSIVLITEADRIVTNARELWTQLDFGRGFDVFCWLGGDTVRSVYVGRGSQYQTDSQARYAWQARAARDGKYGPRPNLDGSAALFGWRPSLGPTAAVTFVLPRNLETRIRHIAEAAGLPPETWMIEALRRTPGANEMVV